MTSDQRTITNPPALHDPTRFVYSHAVSAPGETVYIGGQYASDATGAPVPGDFAAQVDLAFDRLRAALEGVGPGHEHVVRLGTFVVVDDDLDRLETLGKALHARFGDRLPAPGSRHRRSAVSPGWPCRGWRSPDSGLLDSSAPLLPSTRSRGPPRTERVPPA